jgi:hypothetical protein
MMTGNAEHSRGIRALMRGTDVTLRVLSCSGSSSSKPSSVTKKADADGRSVQASSSSSVPAMNAMVRCTQRMKTDPAVHSSLLFQTCFSLVVGELYGDRTSWWNVSTIEPSLATSASVLWRTTTEADFSADRCKTQQNKQHQTA